MSLVVYPPQINLFDPTFFPLTEDGDVARQRGLLALNTEPNALDGFPEYGFVFDAQVLRSLDPIGLAMLPLEVRDALEQEPSFVTADVTPVSQVALPGGGVALTLKCQVTGAEGNTVGFSVATG